MSKQFRAALVGCGRMGATIDDESNSDLPFSHAAGYTAVESVDLVAVVDVVAEKAETIRNRYNASNSYTDYREMIQNEQPDIVSVATRPATHAEIVVFAAENGVKGIYCEKPLCCSMEEADIIVDIVQKHGVKFNYGTQRRYMPIYRKIRELVDAGEIGDVQCSIAQYGASSALWGLTHAADMLLFLAGDPEVDFVQGAIICKDSDWDGNRLNVDPGIASGYIRYSNGVHGYNTAGTGPEYEVCGTGGKIRIQNNSREIQFRKKDGTFFEEVPFPETSRATGTVMGITDIAEALDEDRETKGPLHLARRSQETLMGMIESHRLGGKRVSLPMENRSLYVTRDNW
jgi:predicted dehydrogenase